MTPRLLALLQALWPLLAGGQAQGQFRALQAAAPAQAPARGILDPSPTYDPRYLNSTTRARPGIPVTPLPLLDGYTQQQIGGAQWIYRPDGGLHSIYHPGGDYYEYSPNQYKLVNKTFPQGLIFANNGMTPAPGPRPFPFMPFLSERGNRDGPLGTIRGELFGYPKPSGSVPPDGPPTSMRTDDSGTAPTPRTTV